MNTILITEDDKTLADGLCRALSSVETKAVSCGDLRSAREALARSRFDLLLLDVNLPDGSGFDFLREVRSAYDLPIIMLTANDLETDIVASLEQGADDYITKPFSLAILRARVNAQLRKRESAAAKEQHSIYRSGRFSFDFDRMEFIADGSSVELSKTEQKLLRILTDNSGITLTRSRLIDYLWSDGGDFVDENALSVTVKRLREKLSAKEQIKTVYGIGYEWVKL